MVWIIFIKRYACAMVLILLSAATSIAHDVDFEFVRPIDIEVADISDPAVKKDLEERLIQMAHEVIEGQHRKDFTGKLIEGLSFKKKTQDGIRFNQMYRTSVLRDIGIDSLLLFAGSHATEVLSAPVLISLGTVMSWPDWLLAGIGAAGSVISIPGGLVDPLCILVFATYFKSEKFRKGVSKIRLAIVHGVDTTAQTTGVAKLLKNLWQRQNWVERVRLYDYLTGKEGLAHIQLISENESSFTYRLERQGTSMVDIEIRLKNDEIFVEKIEFTLKNLIPEARGLMSEFFSQFGGNVSAALEETMENVMRTKHDPTRLEHSIEHYQHDRFFVEDVKVSSDKGKVTFKYFERALSLRTGLKLKSRPPTCNKALTAN